MPLGILDDLLVEGRRVLVRADLNVPFETGTGSFRLQALTQTVRELMSRGALVVLLSHWGRPGGRMSSEMSLKNLIPTLQKILPFCPVTFSPESIGPVPHTFVQQGNPLVVLENLRFYPGEEENDQGFVRELASLGDFYVNDALSVCHRAHASIVGLPRVLPGVAGRFLEQELMALRRTLKNPKRPFMAVIGGAKISTKIDILHSLATQVDVLAIGGAMANTFLKARGENIGSSVWEESCLDIVHEIEKLAKSKGCQILLPRDGIIKDSQGVISARPLTTVVPGDVIYDVGPETLHVWENALTQVETVVWNGPLGVWESGSFRNGTLEWAKKLSNLTMVKGVCSVVGGGDTLAALQGAGLLEKFTYVSGAGGAFLQWLAGDILPGLEALKKSFVEHVKCGSKGVAQAFQDEDEDSFVC